MCTLPLHGLQTLFRRWKRVRPSELQESLHSALDHRIAHHRTDLVLGQHAYPQAEGGLLEHRDLGAVEAHRDAAVIRHLGAIQTHGAVHNVSTVWTTRVAQRQRHSWPSG